MGECDLLSGHLDYKNVKLRQHNYDLSALNDLQRSSAKYAQTERLNEYISHN